MSYKRAGDHLWRAHLFSRAVVVVRREELGNHSGLVVAWTVFVENRGHVHPRICRSLALQRNSTTQRLILNGALRFFTSELSGLWQTLPTQRLPTILSVFRWLLCFLDELY